MLKLLPILFSLFILTGCNSTQTPQSVAKPDPQYVIYKSYQEEVLPTLRSGYRIIGTYEKLIRSTNLSPERFIAEGKRRNADTVMVSMILEANNYTYYTYYLRKIDLSRLQFGAEFIPMPDKLRRKFGSNKGCTLGIVYNNTPAFYNDLMTNDVVVSANGSEINSCNHLKKIIYNSYTLNLGIWSNGDKFSIDDFQLNN